MKLTNEEKNKLLKIINELEEYENNPKSLKDNTLRNITNTISQMANKKTSSKDKEMNKVNILDDNKMSLDDDTKPLKKDNSIYETMIEQSNKLIECNLILIENIDDRKQIKKLMKCINKQEKISSLYNSCL